jgi:hypothetical protein
MFHGGFESRASQAPRGESIKRLRCYSRCDLLDTDPTIWGRPYLETWNSTGAMKCEGYLRDNSLLNQGFPGTAAPLYADLVLLLEITLAAGLLIGALLARRKRYRPHALVSIRDRAFESRHYSLVDGSCFSRTCGAEHTRQTRQNILRTGIDARITRKHYRNRRYIYILIAAGTKVLPERLRLTRYKVWMRGLLALWWMVLLLGLLTYARWYIS